VDKIGSLPKLNCMKIPGSDCVEHQPHMRQFT